MSIQKSAKGAEPLARSALIMVTGDLPPHFCEHSGHCLSHFETSVNIVQEQQEDIEHDISQQNREEPTPGRSAFRMGAPLSQCSSQHDWCHNFGKIETTLNCLQFVPAVNFTMTVTEGWLYPIIYRCGLQKFRSQGEAVDCDEAG